jgi:hypothetical protein
MSSTQEWLEIAKEIAQKQADRLTAQWETSLRPHGRRLLLEAAAVGIRTAAGEDTTTAVLALEASTKNLAREQKSMIELQGREIALQAAWLLLGRAFG